MARVPQPGIKPPRASGTANQVGLKGPEEPKATPVPRATAVYDHRRTGMRRNSRNHPFARRAHSCRRGTVATSLTIAIVILEASGMRCPMGVPQPKLSEDGWGRRFMDKRLWYLIAGTRGGINRARILWTLHDRPCNANDLATRLALDYKTVRHHLDVLRENDCVMTLGNEGYGTLYSLSPRLQVHFEDFLEIWRRIESRVGEK